MVQRRGISLTVILGSLSVALVPLFFNRNFYFIDDTSIASTGPWRYLGNKILQGDFSFLDPNLWVGGNWIIEGQFGLFSPITWAVGLFSLLFESVWLYATLVKLTFIVLVAYGTYKSALALKASPVFAMLVGVSAPFCGFSSYFDQAAWFSGLVLSAVTVNYFWISKLAANGRISITAPLLVALCGVAVGYVYIPIVLIVISGAQILSGILSRNKVFTYLAVLISTILASVALYMPALLTAPVTLRSQEGLDNSGWFAPSITGFLTNFLPNSSHLIPNYGYSPMQVPVMYGSILFALLLFAKGKEIRTALRNNLDIVFFLLFIFALLFGPSEFGPLRWPLRFYPLFIIFLLLFLATSLGRVEQFETKNRTKIISAAVIVAVVLAWDQIIQSPWVTLSNFLSVLFFATLWALVVKISKSKTNLKLAALGLASLVLVSASQHFIAPKTPLADFNVPHNVQQYKDAAHLADGRTLYVGNLVGQDSAGNFFVRESSLVGNAWMLADKQVANSYSVAGFAAFNNLMAESYRGEFGGESLIRLFELGKYPFVPLADLMQLDTVVAFRDSVTELPSAPTNWTRDDENAGYVVYKHVNDEDRLPFWIGDNSTISKVSLKNDQIDFQYSTNDNNPAVFIFPRLAWPGYKTSTGQLIEPVNGFLVTLEAPPGKNVKVELEFAPPGWDLSKLLFGIVLFIIVLGEVLFNLRRRKNGTSSYSNLQMVEKRVRQLPPSNRKSLSSRFSKFSKKLYSVRGNRYVLFGILNTLFGYCCFLGANLMFWSQFSPTVILLIGLIPSIVFAYTTHRLFIWRSKLALRVELPKFLTVTFAQFGLNAALLELLVTLKFGILLSQTLITLAIPTATFFIHKYWTFKQIRIRDGKVVETETTS